MLEQLVSHTTCPDFPLVGGRVPLDLKKIAQMPNGEAKVETVNTKLLLEVSVMKRSVQIKPERPSEEEFFNPKIFVHTYIQGSNELGLAVYAKRSDGTYFDSDFRAAPLTIASVEYLLEENPNITAFNSEFREGSDTFTSYNKFKSLFLAQGVGEKQARKLAIGNVWTYTHVASQVEFTEIMDVEELADDHGLMHIYGKYTKKGEKADVSSRR